MPLYYLYQHRTQEGGRGLDFCIFITITNLCYQVKIISVFIYYIYIVYSKIAALIINFLSTFYNLSLAGNWNFCQNFTAETTHLLPWIADYMISECNIGMVSVSRQMLDVVLDNRHYNVSPLHSPDTIQHFIL